MICLVNNLFLRPSIRRCRNQSTNWLLVLCSEQQRTNNARCTSRFCHGKPVKKSVPFRHLRRHCAICGLKEFGNCAILHSHPPHHASGNIILFPLGHPVQDAKVRAKVQRLQNGGNRAQYGNLICFWQVELLFMIF